MPSFGDWTAPSSWACIEFISDLHLSAQTPRTFEVWERYMRQTQADAVLILGDLFDSWAGDDGRDQTFEARCVAVLQQASQVRTLAFMIGNRDFLVGDEMLRVCGMRGLADPIVLIAFGQRYLLTHGDALCLADTEYQRFRALVRDPDWQSRLLARPLQERLALARQLRAGSIERQSMPGQAEPIDIDTMLALKWLRDAGSRTVIHGHTHRPGSDFLAADQGRHVLSDWSFDDSANGRAELLRLDQTGLTRVSLI